MTESEGKWGGGDDVSSDGDGSRRPLNEHLPGNLKSQSGAVVIGEIESLHRAFDEQLTGAGFEGLGPQGERLQAIDGVIVDGIERDGDAGLIGRDEDGAERLEEARV